MNKPSIIQFPARISRPTEVEILNLRPNDILLVTVREEVDQETVTRLRQQFRKALGDRGCNNDVLVVGGDVEYSTLRKE